MSSLSAATNGRAARTGALALLFGLSPAAQLSAGAESRLPMPTVTEAEEVRAAIAQMKRDPRGPYLRLRWYCSDGSVHPPAGSPCATRGGGVQHAELGPVARRLASLQYHVGTVLQSLSYEEFLDRETDHHRIKELILQDYLFYVDDGWVLRRARYYRGARQIEDEERQGEHYLRRLLSDSEWVGRHFLLADRLIGVVPHPGVGEEDLTQRVRGLASELAEVDSSYQDLRVKIHSIPSRDDLSRVTALAREAPTGRGREVLTSLRDALVRLYADGEVASRIAGLEPRLPDQLRAGARALVAALTAGDRARAFEEGGKLTLAIRREVVASADGGSNLLLLDVNQLVQREGFALAQDLARNSPAATRAARLQRVRLLADYATGAGWLTLRERDALRGELADLLKDASVPALTYWRSLSYLARSLDWSVAAGRQFFGPVVERYVVVEPKANTFLDGLVRGSVLLSLSAELDALIADANATLGQTHHLFGRNVTHGIRGLNPGVAQRALAIVPSGEVEWAWDPDKIYAVPSTIAEMRPAAGVLTLDAGNLLSHVQLLARGIGIPNASFSAQHLEDLRRFEGQEVFYAVSPMGVVHLKDPAKLDANERRLVTRSREARAARVKLDTTRLKLDRSAPIPLERLRTVDAGVVVGPKAAKLGQLHHEFPGRVAPGVALPFGLYRRHVDRPFEGSAVTVRQRVLDAYSRAAELRDGGSPEAEIDAWMFEELAWVRRAIIGLPWIPDVHTEVRKAIRDAFGEDLSNGVFVRSDTNLEDLPQFSGAGLNLTVPHQTSEGRIFESIKQVWTSPFSERAFLWRKQVLDDRGEIYPSVLLLRSVPSEKSGVLITSGLQLGDPEDLTIVTGEGVGAAVDGDDAETVLVRPDGSVRLLSQARAPFRKSLAADTSTGIEWVPTTKADTLLQGSDVLQLRRVVDAWRSRQTGEDRNRVWDMEFGFVAGQLWLFQIRPFVRFRNSALLEQLGSLDRQLLAGADRAVALGSPP